MDFESLLPQLTDYGVRILGVLIALWLSFKIAGWAGRKLSRSLTSRNFDETLSVFFGKALRFLILVAAVLACLSVFGIETTSFAAILGAASLAVGLAFQGTLSNFSAGVLLLVFRPFKVGDIVSAAGQIGVVKEIGLFVVALDTPDNRRIIVPNKAVTGGVIENMTHHDKRRVDIDVGTDYSADIGQTRAILEAAAAAIEGRDAELGHQIIVTSLGASSVDWQVRVWCDVANYWAVWEATIHATKKALDDAGIGIPFPQMDVHVDGAVAQLSRTSA